MAFDFAGSGGSGINIGSIPATDDLSALTISVWLKPDTYGQNNYGRILSRQQNGGGWCFALDPQPRNWLQIYRTSSSTTRDGDNAFSLGTLDHNVVTWDGGTHATSIRFYKNGTEVSVYSGPISSAASRNSDAATPLRWGNRPLGDRAFDGLLAEGGLWNVVLTAAEISALAKGFPPYRVRPSALVEYRPMVRNAGGWKGSTPTVTGATVAAHPRIYR